MEFCFFSVRIDLVVDRNIDDVLSGTCSFKLKKKSIMFTNLFQSSLPAMAQAKGDWAVSQSVSGSR